LARLSNNFSYEVIILGALDAKPVQFRIQAADPLENGQVPRLADGFANQVRLHTFKLRHESAKVKPILNPIFFARFGCVRRLGG